MSTNRSSSGVRDLRAIFEEKNNSANNLSLDSRGRSPGRHSLQSRSPSERKVTSSFVAVDRSPHVKMATVPEPTPDSGVDSTAQRRGSVSATDERDQAAIAAVRDALKEDQERRTAAGRPVPDRAVTNGAPVTIPATDDQSEHPDKAISSIKDKDANLTSADVSAAGATKMPSHKKTPSTSGGAKSRMSMSSSTSRPTTTPRPPRASLTAATASSLAKTAGAKSGDAPSPPSKSGRRSPTRPVTLSAHLTRPTASYVAKHESEAKSTKPLSKPLEGSSRLMVPTASSQAKHDDAPAAKPAPAPRKSLAPRASVGGADKPKVIRAPTGGVPATKPSAPPSEGFLSRLTKPTAAMANKFSSEPENKGEGAIPPIQKTSKPAASRPASAVPKPAPAKKEPETKPAAPKTVPKAAPKKEAEKPAEKPSEKPAEKPIEKANAAAPTEEKKTDVAAETQAPAPAVEEGKTLDVPEPLALAAEPPAESASAPKDSKVEEPVPLPPVQHEPVVPEAAATSETMISAPEPVAAPAPVEPLVPTPASPNKSKKAAQVGMSDSKYSAEEAKPAPKLEEPVALTSGEIVAPKSEPVDTKVEEPIKLTQPEETPAKPVEPVKIEPVKTEEPKVETPKVEDVKPAEEPAQEPEAEEVKAEPSKSSKKKNKKKSKNSNKSEPASPTKVDMPTEDLKKENGSASAESPAVDKAALEGTPKFEKEAEIH